jgi:hypothetical protein
MLIPSTKTRITRDIRLALGIHAVFLLSAVSFLIPSIGYAAVLCSTLFLPQWLTFYQTSAFESDQPTALLIARGALGVVLSFVFSLLYAAAWNSLLYLGRSLLSRYRARVTRGV